MFAGIIGNIAGALGKLADVVGLGDKFNSISKTLTNWSDSTEEAADYGLKASSGILTAADYGAKAAGDNKKAAEIQAKAAEAQKTTAAVSASNLLGTTNLAGLSAQSVAADMEVKKTATTTATTAATQAATATAAQPAANGATINNTTKTNGEVTNADLYKLLSDILAALLDGQMISTAQLESLKSISGNTKKNIGGPDLATFVAN